MVVKEIKKNFQPYKGYNYRINISESDNLIGKVKILNCYEYNDLTNEINTLKQQLELSKKEIDNKNREIANWKQKIKTEEDYSQIISDLNRENNENVQKIQLMRDQSLKKIDKKTNEIASLKQKIKTQDYYGKVMENLEETQHKRIKEMDQQHNDQIKKINENNNLNLEKYIVINQLQKAALKRIEELGFIALLKSQHKKIVREQLKIIKEDKKVEIPAEIGKKDDKE